MKSFSSILDSHLSDNFTIQEVGVRLSPENKAKIRARLKLLEDRTPVSSSIQLKFIARNELILAELKITGALRLFRSEIKGVNPWTLYKSLEHEIDKQLLNWKKTRFLNPQAVFPFSGQMGKQMGGVAL